MSATAKPHDVGVPASPAALARLRQLRTESSRSVRGLEEFERRERLGLSRGAVLADEYRRVWLYAVESVERCAREATRLACDCGSIEAATEALGVLADLISVRNYSSSLAAALREGDAMRKGASCG